MTRDPGTYGFALRLWWAQFWRYVLFGMLGGFLIGFFAGFFGTLAGGEKDAIHGVVGTVVILLAFPFNIWVTRRVLRLDFGGYRLALVPVGSLPAASSGARDGLPPAGPPSRPAGQDPVLMRRN